jgi:hypothetical protein
MSTSRLRGIDLCTWMGWRSSGGSCRWRGRARAEQFWQREAGGWIGSGRGARGEGGEAVGRGNLGGVARLRRIPARRSGGSSVSRGGRRGKAAGKRGVRSGFVAAHSL